MKIIRWLDKHFEEYILVCLSALTVIIIFLQVIMRYVFDNSLTWSEELARYMFIWLIYIGVSYAVKEKRHLGVDAITMLFQEKGKLMIALLANVLFLIFALVMTYFGLDIVLRITRESAALQIPLSWIYAAPVAGMTLTSIRLIQNMIIEIKQLKGLKHKNSRQVTDEQGETA
ncbi:TRAP transporter small permease [Oceanobacillus sp. CFH 90083]|uniref:TRAP transporter small permease n=1 Tax=Oceanobacillus sp. CFH 90083 TaxID=2592336 RepID=UPI00128E21C8|nr:TRAP transporter small permease [Oceanobacillus sp. CFH 90083]